MEVTINSKNMSVNTETFQPLVTLNITLVISLETVQDHISKDGIDEFYRSLGETISKAINEASLKDSHSIG